MWCQAHVAHQHHFTMGIQGARHPFMLRLSQRIPWTHLLKATWLQPAVRIYRSLFWHLLVCIVLEMWVHVLGMRNMPICQPNWFEPSVIQEMFACLSLGYSCLVGLCLKGELQSRRWGLRPRSRTQGKQFFQHLRTVLTIWVFRWS